jgi:antirestriction protein ArdC
MKTATSRMSISEDGKFSVQNALQQIEQGLDSISTNEEWLRFLSFQSYFYNYSLNNTLLIYFQKPDARYVCGYNAWRQMNRYVRRGEKGIKILAPCRYKVEREEPDVTVDDIYVIRGFTIVNVFDISQTDGDNSMIPVVVRGLSDESGAAADLYNALFNDIINIPVHESVTLSSKGCYSPHAQEIFIRSDLSDIQRVKTLIHEFAHHLHHTKYDEQESRSLGEVIAESTAFVVCSFLGLDTSEYSIPYIKTWGKDTKQLKTVGVKIQMIASDIIGRIEQNTAPVIEAS